MISANTTDILTSRIAAVHSLKGIELRIMPLGASITFGYLSTQGYGFRKPLQDLLVVANAKVDYVGSQIDGNMPNGHHESKSGETIDKIATRFKFSNHMRPNVVLIHAGTNNLWYDKTSESWAKAPGEIEELIQAIWTGCPDSVLLVSPHLPSLLVPYDQDGLQLMYHKIAKLVHPTEAALLQRTIDFNNAVTAIIQKFQIAGKHILNPDMTQIRELNQDGVHPNDKGYFQMADVWMSSIRDAGARGWISKPVNQYPLAPQQAVLSL